MNFDKWLMTTIYDKWLIKNDLWQMTYDKWLIMNDTINDKNLFNFSHIEGLK